MQNKEPGAPKKTWVDWVKERVDTHPLLRFVYVVYTNGRGGGWKNPKVRARIDRQLRKRSRHTIIPNGTRTTQEDYQAQRAQAYETPLRFSVLMPVYNGKLRYLCAAIRSVRRQTYPDWELCLADGSERHPLTGLVCRWYAMRDRRLKYKRLPKNLGIAGNTNEALALSTGAYIGLLDQDDFLHATALFEMRAAIDRTGADFLYSDEALYGSWRTQFFYSWCKPDYAPDMLRSYNYICHFTVFSRALLEQAGGRLLPEMDQAQDFDLVLRLTEQAKAITHIPKLLYRWRVHRQSSSGSQDAKPQAFAAGKRALEAHLARLGLEGEVLPGEATLTYRIAYKIKGEPLISLLIPNKDCVEMLDRCIRSALQHSTYKNVEVVIVENNSELPETFAYYEKIRQEFANVRTVVWNGPFKFAAIVNFGAQACSGEYILLLNNDIEAITPGWMEEMLMFAQRPDVGAVGAKLYYPNDLIQHAGVIVGISRFAGHSHKHLPRTSPGYMMRLLVAQNMSAVTGACLLVRKEVFDSVGGMDEDFAVAANDVDFCLRLRQKGYLNVFTPYAEMYHYESYSRGYEDTPEKIERFARERALFEARWLDIIDNGDPYYNINLTIKFEDFTQRP